MLKCEYMYVYINRYKYIDSLLYMCSVKKFNDILI